MWWIAFVVLQGWMVYSGMRHAGRWGWLVFLFTLCFLALESLLVSAPVFLIDLKSPIFWPVYIAAWVVAAANFVWFIMMVRRWKRPAA
jgi:hypothetical protein